MGGHGRPKMSGVEFGVSGGVNVERLEVTFKANLDDFVQAVDLGWPKKNRFERRFWFWLIVGTVALVLLTNLGSQHQQTPLLVRILAPCILASFIILLELSSDKPTRRYIERMARENQSLDAQTTFAMDEKGIGHGWGGYQGIYDWGQIKSLETSRDIVVFTADHGTLVFIPTRALTPVQLQHLKDQATSRGLAK